MTVFRRTLQGFCWLALLCGVSKADPVTIATKSLPNATVGAAYNQTLTAMGGKRPLTWSISAGSLPDGLALDPAQGTIAGTPATAGDFNFTAMVADKDGDTDTQALRITVNAAPLAVATASLPPGAVGASYSQTLTASGGSGGYTWAVTAGALPAGLTLSGSGAIAGTPTAAGTANFTATVTDSGGRTASKALSIAISAPPVTVTTSSLPGGTVGAAYSQTLTASGGSGGYTWAVTAGSLPAGLTLSGAGTIAGTPTAAGTANFTVTVTDSGNLTASKPLTIAINPAALTVTTPSLPSGGVGAAYLQTLAASGGTGGYQWSIVAGSLPAGLTLAAGGSISGTPTTAGTANFTVQVKDSAGAAASKALSLTVAAAPLVITTDSLPGAAQGASYSQTLSASGGTGGYQWTVSAGALPAGLTLAPTGQITGVVTGSTASFTAQVTDSAGTVATRNFVITVAAGPTFAGSATLPGGSLGAPYSTTVALNGGQPPYSLALVSGQLPPGLSLNASSGGISGTPTQAGTYSFTLQARDSAGAQSQRTFTIAIAAGVTITTAPVLPAGSVSVPYQAGLIAAGGMTPYTWAATAGSLPAGLTFHPDGTITGTPTATGSFTFTARVTDANGATATKDFTLPVQAGLTITTAPQLPPAVPGAPYSDTLVAVGGRPPYVWSISAGAIPSGVKLDPATGALAGTPATIGTYNFTVNVTDSANASAQKAFALVVAPGLTVTSPSALPDAVAGTPYSYTLAASGGQTPYSWRIADGSLPDGLSLNASTGLISGVPSAAGTFNFTIEVADSTGLKGTRVQTIVTGLPSVPTLAIAGLPATLSPLQQPSIDVALSSPYPVAITGRLILMFTPASGMPDDPAVQFSSGGRSAAFTIPANGTHATFAVPQLALQSGSVAGTIQVTIQSLAAGAVALPTSGIPVQSAQVAPAAFIKSVAVTRTAGGFSVQVVGLSTTRELTGATVRFLPSAGATLTTTEATVPLADSAKAWFQSAGSTAYGGQFTLTLPFSIVGGTVSLDSVTVILTNSAGSSQEVGAPY